MAMKNLMKMRREALPDSDQDIPQGGEACPTSEPPAGAISDGLAALPSPLELGERALALIREYDARLADEMRCAGEERITLLEERERRNRAERDLLDYRSRVELAQRISADDVLDDEGVAEIQIVLGGGQPSAYCQICDYPLFHTPYDHSTCCRFCNPPHMEPDTPGEARGER